MSRWLAGVFDPGARFPDASRLAAALAANPAQLVEDGPLHLAYSGPPSREGTLHDPDRDATTLPLIREAVRRNMPVLAICRGIQELNVALGGTLIQRVHIRDGRQDHRGGEGPQEKRYGPKHPIAVSGSLARILGATVIQVNSLHGQALDRLAPGLVVEATAPDGTIEAVAMPGAPGWLLGVQWHPEWGFAGNPHSVAIFTAFGDACRNRNRARTTRTKG